MPVIRYKLRCADPEDEFWEQDTFERTDDPGSLVNEIVAPLNEKRIQRGEIPFEIVKVEIANPHVHLHSWRKCFTDRNNLRTNYVCDHCGISGRKPYNITKGEVGAEVIRDIQFSKDKKFAFCKDELKELPKKLSFK